MARSISGDRANQQIRPDHGDESVRSFWRVVIDNEFLQRGIFSKQENPSSPFQTEKPMHKPIRLWGVLRSVKIGIVTLRIVMLLGFVVTFTATRPALAQSLNWEGQMGVFVTPLAYSIPSPQKGLGRPVVAYHYLNAGKVLGEFHQASVTVGLFDRVEVGYTRTLHEDGTTAGLSSLWSSGFNTFHGKVNLLREHRTWRPALSVGFVARSQVRNVGGVIQGQNTNNEDFYAVATKTLTRIPRLPLVF